MHSCAQDEVYERRFHFTTIPYSGLYSDLSKGPGYNYKLFLVTSSILIILIIIIIILLL